jgi:hypothetical protein
MKNLRNMLVVSGLMVVFMIGATTANAGIIIIARADQDATVQPVESKTTTTAQCTTDTSFIGIILTDLKGLLVSDAPNAETTCSADTSFYGLLVSD